MTTTPKPATLADEFAMPKFAMVNIALQKFTKAELMEEIQQRDNQAIADLRKKIADQERVLSEDQKALATLTGNPVSRVRRPVVGMIELEKRILAALNFGELSGSEIAKAVDADPNRVVELLNDMKMRKTVAHNGKEKKASRYSLPK